VLDRAFDENGQAALAGTPDDRAVADLGRRLGTQARARRSLGTGDECAAWIDRHRTRVPPADLAASACAAVAATIAKACTQTQRIVLAGGGVRNACLVRELKGRCPVPVVLSDDLGVPAGYREAMAWAVLGALCQDRIPVTLPAITGVGTAPIAGLWCLP
jgi:anhydro-N-acetylmuramic acid kinase